MKTLPQRSLRRIPGAGRKPEGLPNWVITFADMMTLLLTFFILLLSFSVMDAQKYKAIADAMREAFGGAFAGNLPVTQISPAMPPPAPMPADDRALAATPAPAPIESVATPAPTVPVTPPAAQNADAEQLASRLTEVLEAEIAASRLAVTHTAERVIMRFSEDATFPSGSADLIPSTQPILDKVVEVLAQCGGNIIVSGHSDDRPVVGGRFRSNWDLSSARAVSVVHALVLNRKVDAGRVVAAGRAETRPLGPNSSDESRARNRRVEIEILDPRCS